VDIRIFTPKILGRINQLFTNTTLRDVYNWTLYILQNVARNIKLSSKQKLKSIIICKFILKPVLMGETFNKMQGK
jgi:hypothetical protein